MHALDALTVIAGQNFKTSCRIVQLGGESVRSGESSTCGPACSVDGVDLRFRLSDQRIDLVNRRGHGLEVHEQAIESIRHCCEFLQKTRLVIFNIILVGRFRGVRLLLRDWQRLKPYTCGAHWISTPLEAISDSRSETTTRFYKTSLSSAEQDRTNRRNVKRQPLLFTDLDCPLPCCVTQPEFIHDIRVATG